MNNPCNTYSSEHISRFVDNELPKDEYDAVAQHYVQCPDCRRLVEQYKSISDGFTNHMDRQVLKINRDTLELKLAPHLHHHQEKSLRMVFGIFGKNIYLKLASVAAILMISLFMFQEGPLSGPAGPSAIVKSIDTDFTSVMIIETQDEKHTIIWFSET